MRSLSSRMPTMRVLSAGIEGMGAHPGGALEDGVGEARPAEDDHSNADPQRPGRRLGTRTRPDDHQHAYQAGDEADVPLPLVEAADGVDIGGLFGQELGLVGHGAERALRKLHMNQNWAAKPTIRAAPNSQFSQSTP